MKKLKVFNIQYTAELISKKNNVLQVWLAQPTDDLYQKVRSVTFSHTPRNIYLDRQGNHIAYFELTGEEKYELKMNIIIALKKENSSKTKTSLLLKPQTFDKRYIKSEKYLEQTKEIKELTHATARNSRNTIKTIFDFIISNFSYKYPIPHRGVLNLRLNALKGDCAEYSGLFVAMCRILKTPTRNETGFVIFPKENKIVEHAWASVYQGKKGWMDIDTQYASLESGKTGINKYFGKRSDYRISFTHGYNISLKPRMICKSSNKINTNPEISYIDSKAQTLQPIVIVSKHPIKIKTSIILR